MQKYEEASKLSRKHIIINNFIGGISWALGATVGVSLVVAIISFIAKELHFLPFANFIADLTRFVRQKNSGY